MWPVNNFFLKFTNCFLSAWQLKWSTEACALLSSDELARDVQGAEEMMSRHAELKLEIDAKDEKSVKIFYSCIHHVPVKDLQ